MKLLFNPLTSNFDYVVSSHTDIPDIATTFEALANKVTSISGASTDIQYPSAKLLYDQLAGKQAQLNGTGFVKASGTTISYDNSTYLTSLSGAVLTDQTSPQTVGLTGARLAMLWVTDITCTNAISGSVTGNAGTVTNATLTTALTVNTGTLTLTANVLNNSVLTIGAGAVSVSGANTGDQTTMGAISDTKANFNTACSDGNFLFSGDAPTAHAASHAVGAADTVFPADPGADKFLMWDDDPGALVWADGVTVHDLLSATHGDTTASAVARGDIIVGTGATPKWDNLAIGTSGKVLISDGTDAGWSASALGTAAYAATGDFLAVAGKAADSDLLDGHDTAYFQTALTFGIADTNKVQINAADVADNDYARFTATGLEGRSYSEVLSDIGAEPAKGVDDNYVTDAQLVIIGNTSGANTGDNAANSSTMYIGTTQVALNRASATLVLTGITSIDGLSATATKLATARAINGVDFDGTAAINIPSLNWTAVTSNGNLAVDTGTLANKGTLLELTLPTTVAVGKVIRVAGMNAGLFKIVQSANQYIKFGNVATTTGAGGYLASTLAYDCVELVCIVADVGFVVVSSMGSITVA